MSDGPSIAPERCVLRRVLESRAALPGPAPMVVFEDGSAWTAREALDHACVAANALRAGGVKQDERVAVLMGNGPGFLRAWWGAALLGAALVPIHTGFRGRPLEHLLRLARPAAMVADPALAPVLDRMQEPALVPAIRVSPADLERGGAGLPALERPIETWDTEVLLLTSGTTGPSKLARCSYRNLYTGGLSIVHPLDGERDRLLVDLPLFHGGALRAIAGCLATGASFAVRSAPALSAYWETARDLGVTMAMLVGSMVEFVESQPPRAADRDHGLRVLSTNPLPRDPERFMRRFGVARLYVVYGSTEVPGSIRASAGDALEPGYCGRLQPGYQARIVDANDLALPDGQPGELIVRHEQPWVIASEYVANPEASAAAWRNGWFHTGDMLRREPDGRFFFVDRVKDSLRRRGENISSAEVESEVLAHPGVAEAACVACRLPGSDDDEVKVWIVPREGARIDFEALLRACAERMPYFMVPRFFELADALPRTPNERIRKIELRERGNGPRTWDREAQGLTVTRRGIETLKTIVTA